MSAYMVSKKHIDGLVSLVALTDPRRAHETDRDQLGAMLIKTNLDSIHARYPDTIERPDGTPGPNDQYWTAPYLYARPVRPFTLVEGLKLIQCYEYQSCEHAGWETSQARKWCEMMRASLIRMLPGYDTAPWGVD